MALSSNMSGSGGSGGGVSSNMDKVMDGMEMLPLNKQLQQFNQMQHQLNLMNNNSSASLLNQLNNNPEPSLPQTPKTPRRILNLNNSSNQGTPTPKKLQFSTPECSVSIQPSSNRIILPGRKREEAIVMANLRKRVPAIDLTRRSRNQSTTTDCGDYDTGQQQQPEQLDNRVLTKITSKRDLNGGGEEEVKVLQDKDFILDCLCWHNEYRARHGAPALSVSTELCEYAQLFANQLASTNEFYYRSDKNIGQNLFCCPQSSLITDLSGQEVASYWYSSLKRYNFFKEPSLLHTNVNAGHFTQMVWYSSRYFGVGKQTSKTGKFFVVAFYFPPGNVGSFEKNVLPPIMDQDNNAYKTPIVDIDNNVIPSILKLGNGQ